MVRNAWETEIKSWEGLYTVISSPRRVIQHHLSDPFKVCAFLWLAIYRYSPIWHNGRRFSTHILQDMRFKVIPKHLGNILPQQEMLI